MSPGISVYIDPRLANGFKTPLFPDYKFVNGWQGVIGTNGYIILAGAQRKDQTRGVVDLIRSSPSGSTYYEEVVVPTPGRDGAVRLIAVNRDLVVLAAADGAQLTFDIVRRIFL